MANAKVFAPTAPSPFQPPEVITNGWAHDFPVMFHGTDVPNGFTLDSVRVEFLDSDTALAMDNKIRDAVRNKATARGLTVGLTGVVSFAPPRRL